MMAEVLVSYGRKSESMYVGNKDDYHDVEYPSIAGADGDFKRLTISKKRPLSLSDGGRNWTSFLDVYARWEDYYPVAKSKTGENDEISEVFLNAKDVNVFDNSV